MSELSNAIKQICEEKGLDQDSVITTIESALSAAYRKDFGEKNQNIKVKFDPETGKSKVFDVKTVVEDMPEKDESSDAPTDAKALAGKKALEDKEDKHKKEEKSSSEAPALSRLPDRQAADGLAEEERKFNPRTEIQISEAKKIKKTAKIGDEIKTKLEVPDEYGRMAAQTAKQVIVQRLREAEREMIYNEFKGKEKEVVSGVVQRREGRSILIDLGKTVGYLPPEEQIFGEQYNPGERIKIYIKEVRLGSKGPEIVLSRTSEKILKKVFYLEIPEISNGLVELKNVAREAGSRSKVAVWTDSENVDPIGSCVGQRGARIQTIINELGGEKIDIIQYDENPAKFITNALSPAKVLSVDTKKEEKKAIVKVLGDQLSLAIGKNGQNARLAARLTGWKIDIVGSEEKKETAKTQDDASKGDTPESKDNKSKRDTSQSIKDDSAKKNTKSDKENKKEEKKTENKKTG